MHEASGAVFLLGVVIVVATAVLVGPVWLAAKAMGARRAGLVACLAASLLAALAYQVTAALLPSFSGVLLGVAEMAVVYALVLRMGVMSGLGVALIASLLQWLLLVSLSGVLVGKGEAGAATQPPAQVIEM